MNDCPGVASPIPMLATRFALVGALGFLVDAGVLSLATSLLGLNLYLGRALSFLAAVTFTWALNRRITFPHARSSSRLGEWARFCAANSLGGAVNLGIYGLLVISTPLVRNHPTLGVAAGSLSGLAINFTLSHTFVFRKAPGDGDAHRPCAPRS